ncbi:MAG: TonB-dependent receptor [Gemmatimonadaceae bacterium]|nr:TonB-dependent receptor [Gemmatimonadaceae bacterium]
MTIAVLRSLGAAGGLVLALAAAGRPADAQTLPEVARPAVSTPPTPGDAVAPRNAPATRARGVQGKRVTLRLTNATIDTALRAIAAQSGIELAYSASTIPVDRRISIDLVDAPLMQALDTVLHGLDVSVTWISDHRIALSAAKRRSAAPAAAPDSGTGTVLGRVVDSTSRQPLAAAVVSVEGTTVQFVANDSGYFVLSRVPVGVRTIVVRHLGYVAATRQVVVTAGAPVRVDIALRMGMTRLQDVVTTASGPRRRYELGNDITIVNADSIVATQPVSNVTALLEGRVPGLTVQHTSGAPGDPSRLRLRGAASFTRSNDPIVIVDGVRIYAAQSDARSTNLADEGDALAAYSGRPGGFGAATPSPLDEIDPNSIETIEVLKGPSAATLYGADAANGVIVIATKKGRSGPPRWTVSADRGLTYMPGRYPAQYFRWGHTTSDDAPRWCPVIDLSCTADSVVRFQPLNDPDLTMLGHGEVTRATAGVSGGSDALSYAFTGSASEEVGLLTLPRFVNRQFRAAHGSAPPSWMRRPHDYKAFSGTSRIRVRLGADADVSLTTMFSCDDQQRSSLENQLGQLMYTYIDPATNAYLLAGNGGYLSSPSLISDFYQRATDEATTFRNALSVTWRPAGWLSGSADAGLDLINRADEILVPRGYSPAEDSVGVFNRGTGSSLVSTLNLRGTATAPLPWGFALQTAVGANYTGTRTDDASFYGYDIPVAAVSPMQAKSVRSSASRASMATFGMYVEPTLSRKHLWLSTGLRMDGGSTFGEHAKLAGFPKVSLSYLLSDEPFFPFKGLFNTLRLRAAYGHAGVQPGVGDQLRIYGAPIGVPLDSQAVDIVLLTGIGNTTLKPERSTELEGGIDADLLDDRLSLSVSGYRKTRKDALMRFPLPPSVFGDQATIERNIGVVRNTGIEASISAQLLRRDALTWSAQLQVSHNRNVVVSLAPGVAGLNNATGGVGSLYRLAVGYPLFGIWARPIVGYADVNGNGVIEPGEVQVGDSAMYMGASMPDYDASLSTGVSLFRGAVRVDASFQYEHGLTQIDGAEAGRSAASRALNDPTASPGELAGIVALAPDLGAGLQGPQATPYAVIQNVSLLRFSSLSVAYAAPPTFARRLGASAVMLALQGTNLGLFTHYRGKDPNVNSYPNGNNVLDAGALPAPRTWQLRVSVQY